MDPNLSDQNLQIKHLQNGVSMNSKFSFLIAIDLVPKKKKTFSELVFLDIFCTVSEFK